MILFRKLRWKNLLSTGNFFTELNLNSESATLIVGTNGSGKSTMLDALCFCLFGKPFRNINKLQLVNSINAKDTVIEVELDIGSKSYKIIRGIKPNLFEIYCNDNLLSQDASIKDYQEYLEKFILKLNYKSFTQIVILGSASFTPFMQLSASDRRSIIEDLLDIQIFSRMNSIVKDKVQIAKENISEKKHELGLLEQKYNLKKEYVDELKRNNEDRIAEYIEEIQSNQSAIQTFLEEISIITKQIETLNAVVENKNEIENKIKKFSKLESQIESNVFKFQKDIHFFEHNDNCPTCRQAIALKFKETQLSSLTIKAEEYNTALEQLLIKLNTEQSKLDKIAETQKKINTLQVKIASDNSSIIEMNKQIAKLNKQIEDIRNASLVSDKDEQELTLIKEQLNNLKNYINTFIDELNYYNTAALMLKDTGIKTKIVKQYLPVINKLVNKYLTTLDFFVNFNLDESFKETIKSRHRDDFSYASFSEGEKQRIDMALMLTWRAVAKLKNSTNTNILILDEIFDSSLDANGTEDLMRILAMLENTNLFVISHKGDVLQDKFRNVIRFEKINNFSRIIK
jgi:DNA repair exonuclease SbcCD ATPase subunit